MVFNFREQFVLVPSEDGLVIDGHDAPRLLKGLVVETALTHIVEMQQGAVRPHNAVLDPDSMQPVPEDLVGESRDILRSFHMLKGAESEQLDAVTSFLLRADACESTREVGCSVQLMGDSRVDLYSSAGGWEFGGAVATCLEKCGISKVSHADRQGDHRALLTLRLVAPCELSILTVRSSQGGLVLDLMVGQDECPCEECTVFEVGARLDATDGLGTGVGNAAWVAWEVVDILRNTTSRLRQGQRRIWNLRTFSAETRTRSCVGAGGVSVRNLLVQYNLRVSGNTGIQPIGGMPGPNLQRGKISGDFPLSRQILLPVEEVKLAPLSGPILFQRKLPFRGALDISSLGAMLAFSCGIRTDAGAAVKRWAPNAGNLGSVSAHVLTLGMEGLDAGLYTFDPATHRLATRVGERSVVMSLLIEICGHGRPEALIIFSSRRDLLIPKYKEFSVKLSGLDAGVAQAQMHLVASALGILAAPVSSWPDAPLERALNLVGRPEEVTGIVAIANGTAKLLANSRPRYMSANLSQIPTGIPISLEDVTQQVLQTGRFVDRRKWSIRDLGFGRIRRQGPKGLTAGPLPTITTGDLLASRRSVRDFAIEELVDDSKVMLVLAAASNHDRLEYSWEHARRLHLNFVVFLRRDAGHFEAFLVGQGITAPIAGRVDANSLCEILGQDGIAKAAVIVIAVTDLTRASAILGGAAFRHFLFRAGAAVQRISMMYESMGYGSCVHAGIRTQALLKISGNFSATWAPLLACVGGRPA